MSTTFERVEADIRHLSLTDQLRLMETLAADIRRRTEMQALDLEGQLRAMALDPEIQQELRAIESEFAGTEADGLGAAA